jgi:hypothetical protein
MVLFIPKWGLVGAGVAIVIANGVICLGYYFPGQKIFQQTFEVNRLLKLIGVVAILGLVGLISLEPAWLSVLLKTILLVLGTPILLFVFKFFDANERNYLLSGFGYIQKRIRLVTI